MATKIDRTKEHIIKTFFEMMAEVGFEQIRVSTLAKRAEINRGTFYHHFMDKEEIIEEIEKDIYENFKKMLDEHIFQNFKDVNGIQKKCLLGQLQAKIKGPSAQQEIPNIFQQSCLQMVLFFHERKEVMAILMGENGRPQFIERLERLYCETVRGTLTSSENHEKYYLQEFVLTGVISVIKSWLRKGAVETPEKMSQILTTNFTTTPSQIFGNDFDLS